MMLGRVLLRRGRDAAAGAAHGPVQAFNDGTIGERRRGPLLRGHGAWMLEEPLRR
ncbi:MAG: hypothetical protein M5U28_07500 [Sandaracinaceae bacterium]|nr:hypothetical protein [Sandaracinaceae bacterium]